MNVLPYISAIIITAVICIGVVATVYLVVGKKREVKLVLKKVNSTGPSFTSSGDQNLICLNNSIFFTYGDEPTSPDIPGILCYTGVPN